MIKAFIWGNAALGRIPGIAVQRMRLRRGRPRMASANRKQWMTVTGLCDHDHYH